jgi:predicted metal-binding membrane protein
VVPSITFIRKTMRLTIHKLGELSIPALILGVSALLLFSHQYWYASAFGRALLVAGFSSHWPHDLTFILNWTLMCGAMMLPTSVQMVTVSLRYWQESNKRVQLVLTVIAGFLSVWTVTGILLVLFSELLARTDTSHLATSLPEGASAAILLAFGGAYLLSPLAQACAKACRSPLGFFARQSGSRSDQPLAFRIGIEYGANCFGCCWPLMAVMAVFGLHGLAWMLAGTLFMALQKSSQFSASLTKIAGIAFLILSGVAISGQAPFLNSLNLAVGYHANCGEEVYP